MTTKAKKENNENNNEGWKALVMGFVGNVMERISDNVSTKVHKWTKQMKRVIAGSVVMAVGATFFLTGLSTYVEAVYGKTMPGSGNMIIGIAAVLIGYLVSRK